MERMYLADVEDGGHEEESLLDGEMEQKILALVRDTLSFCKWSILCTIALGAIEGMYTYSIQSTEDTMNTTSAMADARK